MKWLKTPAPWLVLLGALFIAVAFRGSSSAIVDDAVQATNSAPYTKSFQVGSPELYHIEFNTNSKSGAPPLVFKWHVSLAGKVVEQGTTRDVGNFAGEHRRVLGEFQAAPGTPGEISIAFTSDTSRLSELHPRVNVRLAAVAGSEFDENRIFRVVAGLIVMSAGFLMFFRGPRKRRS